jgi:hypothetical protein
MSPMVARIAEKIDPGAFASRKGKMGERQIRALRRARNVLHEMFDAPKDALVAGLLYTDSEKDLAIWNAMVHEMLRD